MLVADSQVHIWSPDTPETPWPSGAVNARHRFLGAEALIREMDAVGVDRAVLVPPVFAGDRSDAALAAARRFPDRFGVVGRLALDRPESREQVATWLDTPGMLGIRQSFALPQHRALLQSGAVDWFWPAAEAAQVPVYLFCPGLLDVMGEVARAHPKLRLVICHFALQPDAGIDDLRAASEQLPALARHPNVAVMASALPCHAQEPFPFPSLREPVRRVVAAFGATRVFWGSDLTRLPCTYREAVDFGRQFDFLSSAELEQVMGAGLRAWLGWR